MELSIPQIAAIIVTVLIARALSKKRKKKDQDNIDSLYPPDMRQKDRIPDKQAGIYDDVPSQKRSKGNK